MFRHPRRTRGLHVYQREGRCRILIASHTSLPSPSSIAYRGGRVVRGKYENTRGSGGTGGNKEEALERDKSRERERRPAMRMVQGASVNSPITERGRDTGREEKAVKRCRKSKAM